jgi:tetratricopeptide (TPR) repeat protein
MMDADMGQQILDELRNHTRVLKGASRAFAVATAWLGILVVLTMVSLFFGDRISAAFRARETPPDSWREARALMDRGDLQPSREMLGRMIARNPRNFYNHRLLGFVEQQRGNLVESEAAFARAFELFPSEENEKNLAAIRRVRERTKPATP